MKKIFSFLSVLSWFILVSSQTPEEYYRKQREESFTKYMRTMGSASLSAGVVDVNFKIDPKAVEEMVSNWRKKKSSSEDNTSLESYMIKREQRRQTQESLDAIKLNTKVLFYDMIEPLEKYYQKAGFQRHEAGILAARHLYSPNSSEKNPSYTIDYREDGISRTAVSSYQEFKLKANTATFEDLQALIANFDIAGYTALKSLELLEKRFPEKKSLIETLKPYHAISYWKEIKIDVHGIYPEISTPNPEIISEMNQNAINWFTKNPASFLELVNIESISNQNLSKLFFNENSTAYKQWLKMLVMKADVANKGEDLHSAVISGTSNKKIENEQIFLEEDFQFYMKHYGFTFIETLEFLKIDRYNPGVYLPLLMKYSNKGEDVSQYFYARYLYNKKDKNSQKEAIEIFKKLYSNSFLLERGFIISNKLYKELDLRENAFIEWHSALVQTDKYKNHPYYWKIFSRL